MTQALERGSRMLELGLPEATGNGKSVDRGSSGDVLDDDLYVRTANLRRNMTARAEIENGQRSKASGILPSAIAQVSVSDAKLLESGDLEKGWKR